MRYMLIHTADPDVAAEWDESENWAAFSTWVEIRPARNSLAGR